MTRFRAKFRRLSNCTKIVRWSKGDLIPSDYGTHHGRAAKLCGEQCGSNKFSRPSLKRGCEQFRLSGHSARNSRFIYVEGIVSNETMN